MYIITFIDASSNAYFLCEQSSMSYTVSIAANHYVLHASNTTNAIQSVSSGLLLVGEECGWHCVPIVFVHFFGSVLISNHIGIG